MDDAWLLGKTLSRNGLRLEMYHICHASVVDFLGADRGGIVYEKVTTRMLTLDVVFLTTWLAGMASPLQESLTPMTAFSLLRRKSVATSRVSAGHIKGAASYIACLPPARSFLAVILMPQRYTINALHCILGGVAEAPTLYYTIKSYL